MILSLIMMLILLRLSLHILKLLVRLIVVAENLKVLIELVEFGT